MLPTIFPAMTWTAMIDESSNDGHSPILAMAALLAVDDRWADLEVTNAANAAGAAWSSGAE